jgi:hypothetical protein
VTDILIIRLLKKIKRFEKIMVSCNVVFTVGLRGIQPETDAVHPFMHLAVQVCAYVIHSDVLF